MWWRSWAWRAWLGVTFDAPASAALRPEDDPDGLKWKNAPIHSHLLQSAEGSMCKIGTFAILRTNKPGNMTNISKFFLASLPIALAGCAIKPSAPPEAPIVVMSYVDARDELFPGRPTGTSGTVSMKDVPSGVVHREPHISVARKCNADHNVCKEGVVTVELKYTTRYIGSDWIMEGYLTSSIARTATLSMTVPGSSQSLTQSIPAEVQLIDDEPTVPKHFRWVVRPGTSLDLAGPAGTHFHAEAS